MKIDPYLLRFKTAMTRVMYAPMSFYETTVCPINSNPLDMYCTNTFVKPLGRIMNRFAKGRSPCSVSLSLV